MASQEHSPKITKPEVLDPLADFPPIVSLANSAHLPAAKTQSVRRSGNFPPPIWNDHFASFSLSNTAFELYAKQIDLLKERVKDMLMVSSSDLLDKVSLIDLLCHLGVSYHFQSEIEEQLKQIFDAQANLVDNHDYDLYTVALLFRVFRQHGYKMPCDVFKKFKDSDGKFKETLTSDAKGMLSLYEASFLGIHGEDILDKALAFTKAHLESLATRSSPHLGKHIMNALNWPFHRCIPRLATRQYISFYEEDESRNETLLQFAKLDFNRVQLLHQHELSQLTRWYKDLNVASQLPYARHLIVEIHLWTIGMYFEPQYTDARIIVTKAIAMISLLDDTYDVYGTIEELDRFTDAIQRWDSNALDQLPEYMKFLYRIMLNLFDEWENELTKEGRSYSVKYARDAMKELARSYHVEAQWFSKGYVPPIDEYMDNALITSSYIAIATSSFIGMGDIAGIKAFEWLQPRPKILRACETIGRIMNDMVSHKAEQKRGDAASFIECYMKQYGDSEKDMIEEIDKRLANAWKDVNEECMRPTSVSMHLLMRIVNLTRSSDLVYKYDDGYSTPEGSIKVQIISLFVDQIPI